MGDHTGASRPAIHTSKGHGARHSAWGRLQPQVHTILCDGTGIVSGRLPRQVSTLRTLCVCVWGGGGGIGGRSITLST